MKGIQRESPARERADHRMVSEDLELVRAGRSLVVSQATVSAFAEDAAVTVAIMLQTNFRIPASAE